MICSLKAGDPRKLVAWSQSKSEGLRTRRTNAVSSSPREKIEVQTQSGREHESSLPLPFWSVQALSGMAEANLPWRVQQSAVLSLLFPMLISSGNTPTDTPSSNV